MSEENIKLTAIIRRDIRNPVSNLVFSPTLGAEYDRYIFPSNEFTKDSVMRTLRNITHSKFVKMGIGSDEINLVHTLQRFFVYQEKIDEIEIIAETVANSGIRFDIPFEKQISQRSNPVLATLKLPKVKLERIIPTKDKSGTLVYYMQFDLSGGSSLISY